MEENKITKSHKIVLGNRKSGSITGVLDVISFDITEVLLETEQGMLNIKGKDLHVNRLNLVKICLHGGWKKTRTKSLLMICLNDRQ